MACVRQIGIAPVATGSRVIAEDQGLGLCLPRAHALIKVAWPSANGPKVDDFSVVSCGDRGHGDGVLVDILPHIECARVRHG